MHKSILRTTMRTIAPDGDGGGSTTEPAPAPPAPAPPPATGDEVLGEAGLKALRAERARADAASRSAADLQAQLQEFQDRDKSDLQRAQEMATKAGEEAAKATLLANRFRVASRHGIDEQDAETFLTAGSAEEMEAQAVRLAEIRGSTTPPPPPTPMPDPSAGATGSVKPANLTDALTAHYASR